MKLDRQGDRVCESHVGYPHESHIRCEGHFPVDVEGDFYVGLLFELDFDGSSAFDVCLSRYLPSSLNVLLEDITDWCVQGRVVRGSSELARSPIDRVTSTQWLVWLLTAAHWAGWPVSFTWHT